MGLSEILAFFRPWVDWSLFSDDVKKRELQETLGASIEGWLSKSLNSEQEIDELKSEVKGLRKKELKTCINILKNKLNENVLGLLFWKGNYDNIKKKEFDWHDLLGYFWWGGDNWYLRTTDFWNYLFSKNIIIQKIWWELPRDKLTLSLQYWINRSKWDGIRVNVPFNPIFKGSNKFNIEDKIKIEFLWNTDKVECVVRLLRFLQNVQKYSQTEISSRELWIFWV